MPRRKPIPRERPESSLSLVQFLIIVALCGIILAVAVPIGLLMISNEPAARHLLVERFEQIAVGDAKEQVLEILGSPGLICLGSKGIYPHQIWAERRIWEAMEKATVERWIYPLPLAEIKTGQRNTQTEMVPTDQSCRPGYAEGEVGFGVDGQVLWFISLTDESYVVHRKKPRRPQG